MTDSLARQLRQVVASANLPDADASDPHHHGKPTNQREPAHAAASAPVVLVNAPDWPSCEFCSISRDSVPATVRVGIGYGSDRNLCDDCCNALAFGQPRRELIAGLGHLVKPTNPELRSPKFDTERHPQ